MKFPTSLVTHSLVPMTGDPQFYEKLIQTSLEVDKLWKSLEVGPVGDDTIDRQIVSVVTTRDRVWQLPTHDARRELMQQLHFQARWVQNGLPVFQLTHGLAAALLLTDFGKQTGEALRFPFPAFVVGLPVGDAPLRFTDYEGQRIDARWLTVHCYRQVEGDEAGRGLDEEVQALHQSPLGMTPQEYVAAVRGIRAKWDSKQTWLPTITLHVHTAGGLSIHTTQKPPRDDEPIERWIRDCSYRNTWANDDPIFSGPLTPEDQIALGAAARIVANLCFYINGQKEVPRKPGTPESSPLPYRPTSKTAAASTWVVGKEVKLPKGLRDAARAYAERGRHPKQWRVRARFVVRGHWRNQACGTGRTEHRQKWISPHWKGPADSSAALTRLYDAATEEERKP